MLKNNRYFITLVIATLVLAAGLTYGAESEEDMPNTEDRPGHQESAQQHKGASPEVGQTPQLPEGMTLDEVLDYSQRRPPSHFPDPLHDEQLNAFAMFEQLEYRIAEDASSDHTGWEAHGWFGGDFNKFWWKQEGDAAFDGPDEGDTETDFLYSRLITPFWNFQLGAQYANEWIPDDYDDRFSGVIAFQGLAPYKFELDNSLYISEDGDVTFEFGAEYDLWITQRLVIQPGAEFNFAARDIPDRDLGAGMTDGKLDLRLRYEITRDFAPYIGSRYQFLVGETKDIADDAGVDPERLFFVTGLRIAF